MSSFLHISELSSETPTSNTIYINPRFRNAHINPNFLPRKQLPPQSAANQQQQQPFNIHINPLFLSSSTTPVPAAALPVRAPSLHPPIQLPKTSIISQTSRKLVRQPFAAQTSASINRRAENTTNGAPPLVKIGKRKLVRVRPVSNRAPLSNSNNTIENKAKFYVRVLDKTAYKIDRRSSNGKRSSFHGGINMNESLKSTRVIVTDRRLSRIGQTPEKLHLRIARQQAKFEMVNINGVLYNTSSNKLQRHAAIQTPSRSASSSSANRCLTIRGTKFFVDQSGSRLRRDNSISSTTSLTRPPAATMHRIDVGGMTYVEVAPNQFQRTDSHRTRVHLNAAIQKSINLLARNRTKNNVPCAIYRRLGKCIALERGRCPKVHDPQRVSICPKFVKGCCLLDDDCLLSHSVTLSKMPTCKFFLAGMCVRSNCPYLHKKVNAKTAICEQFVVGFCPAAEKCSKRHEFLCPEFESKGSCQQTRCKLPHKTKSSSSTVPDPKPAVLNIEIAEPKHQESPASLPSDDTISSNRYFYGKDSAKYGRSKKVMRRNDSSQTVSANPTRLGDTKFSSETQVVEQVIPSRPKLGVLPSYIPIERDSDP